MLLDAIKAATFATKLPEDSAKKAYEREMKKRAKPIRPRDRSAKPRSAQAQSALGQAAAGQIGGAEGTAARRRRNGSPISPLGGLGNLGIG